MIWLGVDLNLGAIKTCVSKEIGLRAQNMLTILDLIDNLGGCALSYILHTRAFGTYLWGSYLPCTKDYKVMVFYM